MLLGHRQGGRSENWAWFCVSDYKCTHSQVFTPSSLNFPSWLITACILFQSLPFVWLAMVCLKSPSVFNAHGFQCFLRVLCPSRLHYFLYISLITALILPLASSPLCTHILFLSALSHGGITEHPLVSSPASYSLALYSQPQNPTPYHPHLQHKKPYTMAVFTNISVAALL